MPFIEPSEDLDYPPSAVEAIEGDQLRLNLTDDEVWERWRSQPDLREFFDAAQPALVATAEWLSRFCQDSPIVFGGEGELGIAIQEAIEVAERISEQKAD